MTLRHIMMIFSLILIAGPWAEVNAFDSNDRVLSCDVCVVGGGSGGFGAALAAARSGADVILVEKQSMLGGTSTSAFVSNWEPGPGCFFARELYERMREKPGSVAIAPRVHAYRKTEPYGMCYGTPEITATYEHTLRRAGIPSDQLYSVVMKPKVLAAEMKLMLEEAGVRILLETTFNKADSKNDFIKAIYVSTLSGDILQINSNVFIDCTGNAVLCRRLYCETMLGVDPKNRFFEPSAPEVGNDFLNAISLCYRIVKSEHPKRQARPSKDVGEFGKTAFVSGVDTNELCVNPLPLVAGKTLIEKGYAETNNLARHRVLAHWHWLQGYEFFSHYELEEIAPMLGIRESYRVVTDYILTEHDIRAGLHKQEHRDIIAIADHPLDVHGGGSGVKELNGLYGIPYRCLLPKGYRNLLVACRAAGFSHIAASSCRLSRTMMALGHAAGLAAGLSRGDVREIDVSKLVEELK